MEFLINLIGNNVASGKETFPKILKHLRIREQTPSCRIYPNQEMVESKELFETLNMLPRFIRFAKSLSGIDLNWDTYELCQASAVFERTSYILASALTKNESLYFREIDKINMQKIKRNILNYIDNYQYNTYLIGDFIDETDFYPPLLQDFLYVYVKAFNITLIAQDYLLLLGLIMIAKSRIEFYTFNTSLVALVIIHLLVKNREYDKIEEITYLIGNFCEETIDNFRKCREYFCLASLRPEFKDFFNNHVRGGCQTVREWANLNIDDVEAPDQTLTIIDCGKARIKKVLGKGAYGSVSIGKIDRKFIAVKKFQDNESLIDEYVNAKNLDYRFLAKPLGYNLEHGCITYQLMMQDLDKYIDDLEEKGKNISDIMIRVLMYQLLQGVEYLHANNTVHLDLKPPNVLLDKNFYLEVADMGISAHCSFNLLSGLEQRFPVANTATYRPPEYFGDTRLALVTSIDMWAVGVMMIEMYSGVNPFWNNMKLMPGEKVEDAIKNRIDRVLKDVKSQSWKIVAPDIPDDAIDLLNKLLTEDPSRRISATAALNHPYNNQVKQMYSVLTRHV